MQPPARDALARAHTSAVHLEMRDHYRLDDPGYIAWRAGTRIDPADRTSWWDGWHDHVAAAAERGVSVRRARIVAEPVTDYVRWEHHLTFGNVAAGEVVRWLPRRLAVGLMLPATDFWLFDGATLLLHHFGGDGRLDEDGREYTTDPGLVEACAAAFEAVWQRAIPHEEYRPR